MKRTLTLLALAGAIGLPYASALAQESLWQNSYQLESAGKYGDAIVAMEAVPPNGPDAELKLLRRGWLFYQSGKFDESIREYRLAIERNSRSLDARLGLVLPMLASKRWREAEQASRAALDIAPHNYAASVRLAIAQEGMQDWAALSKTAVALVTDYPSDATAYTYLARANAWQGKRPEALAAYNAVLVRYPTHLEARAYLDKK
jgi:tetratricopeptide (TPR) repeat protein